jgi:threonine aldolase
MIGLHAADGRIGAAQLDSAVKFALEMGVHHAKPAAVSVTQASEWGTVYAPARIAELAEVARRHDLRMHMDGARFANALAHLGCTPAEATWRCGIDALSLGATKNGALCAELVVFFRPALAKDFDRRHKQSGHLWSKMRYLSAQLLAYFADDLWLCNARHANAMAGALARGLASAGARLVQPVEANEIFIAFPARVVAALESQGFGFYRWPARCADGEVSIRLVTSYATAAADVEALIAAALAASRVDGAESR